MTVLYPIRRPRDLLPALLCQLQSHNITIQPSEATAIPSNTTIILDALFGFSFKPSSDPNKSAVRAPFDVLIKNMNEFRGSGDADVKLVAVDVPSAWMVDAIGGGGDEKTKWMKSRVPEMVVSLTAPKKCVEEIGKTNSKVVVMCGGRFVPKALEADLGIVLPKYENAELVATIQ